MRRNLRVLCLCGVVVAGAPATAAQFVRGDANRDGTVNTADAVAILGHLFLGQKELCRDALDVTDNGRLDLADAVRLLGHLFGFSQRPPPPFPDCGDDPTPDAIDCAQYNEALCPATPPLVISGVMPATGPPDGGTPIVITGSGFSHGALQVSLCGNPVVNAAVIDDARIEAVTPPGEPLQACALAITDGTRTAELPSAFAYEDLAAPGCVDEADVAQSFSTLIDQTICLPSPLFQFDLMGSAVVLCPEGSLCSGGQGGCDFTFKEAAVSVDLAARRASAEFTGVTIMPVDVGTTLRCTAELTMIMTLTAELDLRATQWQGIEELMGVGNVTLALSSLDVNATGGLLCGLLNLSGGLLQETIQGLLDSYTDELFAALNLELGGIYVCRTQ